VIREHHGDPLASRHARGTKRRRACEGVQVQDVGSDVIEDAADGLRGNGVTFAVDVPDVRALVHGEPPHGNTIVRVPFVACAGGRRRDYAFDAARPEAARQLGDVDLGASHDIGVVSERDVDDSHWASLGSATSLRRSCRTRRHVDAIDSARG
jgi:hypothetical protein